METRQKAKLFMDFFMLRESEKQRSFLVEHASPLCGRQQKLQSLPGLEGMISTVECCFLCAAKRISGEGEPIIVDN